MIRTTWLGLLFGIFIFGFSLSAEAANTDLVALSRGKVVNFIGIERISQPFAFDLEMTVSTPALNFATVIGQTLEGNNSQGSKIIWHHWKD